MKIVPTVKEITSVRSWQANLPWIIVGAGVALIATWLMSNYTMARIVPAQAIEMRSPTRVIPSVPSVGGLYHPMYDVDIGTPTYAIGISSPSQGVSKVGRFRVY